MTCKKYLTINEAYSDMEDLGGIFTSDNSLEFAFSERVAPAFLDRMFMASYSKRLCADIITQFINDDEEYLVPNGRIFVTQAIYYKFNDIWAQLFNTLNYNYDFLSPYHISETFHKTGTSETDREGSKSETITTNNTTATDETNTIARTDTITGTQNNTTTFGKIVNTTDQLTKDESHTDAIQGTQTDNTTDNTTNKTWAFNSLDASNTTGNDTTKNTTITTNNTTSFTADDVHSATGSNTESGTETLATTKNNTQGISGTNTVDNDVVFTGNQGTTGTNTDSISAQHASQHTLTRSGSLGTAPQILIRKQREIVDYDILQKIMHDVARYITLPIF